MASNTKHNKRKFAAVALALVGVAGLSVASAATLTVDAANEVAIGEATFAACDTDGVTVDYGYLAGTTDSGYQINQVTVTGIDAQCDGENVTVKLAGAEHDVVFTEATDGSTATLDFYSDNLDIEDNVGTAVVIIG